MSAMWDTIIKKHGDTAFSPAMGCAIALGIDDIPIMERWEQRIGERDEFMELMGYPPLTLDDVADGAYWELVKTCRAKYFGEMSRETALAIGNALVSNARLYLAEDLQFNADGFVYEWNKAHPEEQSILWNRERWTQ